MQQQFGIYFHSVAEPTSLHRNLLRDKVNRLAEVHNLNTNLHTDYLDAEPTPTKKILPQKKESVNVVASNPVPTPSAPVEGLSAILYDELPDNLKVSYDRIRFLTPLIATLHGELSHLATDAERKQKAAELCKLDDERRTLWDELDRFSADGGKPLAFTAPPSKDESSLSQGLFLARRRRRLQDNIRKARRAKDLYEKEGKEAQAAACAERMQRYTQELDTLEKEIANVESRS